MSDLNEYAEKQIAILSTRYAGHSSVVDTDDYISAMRIEYRKRTEKVETARDSKKYLNKLLYNRTREVFRSENRYNKKISKYHSEADVWYSRPSNPEESCISSDLLERVRNFLEASEWSLLVKYIENERYRDTWKAMGEPTTEAHFRRCIQKIQRKCREKISEITA